MFARLLWKLLHANRGRLAVALVALVSGAAVISALISLDLDAGRKLTQEFRTLGANLIVEPPREPLTADTSPASPQLMDDSILKMIEAMRTPEVVAAAPYLYFVVRAGAQDAAVPVVVVGTWLDQARQLSPTWKVMGNWIDSREDRNRCLVGRNVAQRFKLAPGVQIELRSAGVSALETVVGVVEAGGAEDNQIFLNLPEAQKLAGVGSAETAGKIQLVELSVSGSAAQIDAYAKRLRTALPSLEVRPIRQLAESEGQLLARIQLLIFSMVLLILVLTTLCVLATMAALAMERREDVGLMKALGGSISRVVNLFLAEAGVLGAVGGLLGYFLGLALSQWIGERVFGTAISARLDVLPLTVALMIGVALAGALPLRLLGKIRPAVILRGE